MKMRKLALLIGACVITSSSVVYSAEDRVIGADEMVELLNPQSEHNVKTRGIRLNQPSQPAQGAEGQADVAAQQQAAVEDAAAVPPPSVSMDIPFEYNSANLTTRAIEQLNPLGQALSSNELAGYGFLIEGHTDASGAEDYNMQLSQRRAEAVGNYLYQNYGVDPASLNLVGRGESALLDASNPNNAVNRRVSVTTISQ